MVIKVNDLYDKSLENILTELHLYILCALIYMFMYCLMEIVTKSNNLVWYIV